MLPKNNRLPRQEFNKVFTRANFLTSGPFSVRILRGMAQQSRFSVVVPTSVTKSKPLRNRYRRLVYTLLRTTGIVDTAIVFAIIFLKKDALKLSRSDFVEQFQIFAKNVKLLK